MAARSSLLLLCLALILSGTPPILCTCTDKCAPLPPFPGTHPIYPIDVDLLQVALNLEFLETEWFLFGALGYGLDKVAPHLAMGGPPPIGARKANLDETTQRIIEEFGYQEVGHMRAITTTVGGFPRPLIDLSSHNFAKLFDEAVGRPLSPPFDPYENSINYVLASYVIPYVGMVGYVGANPNIYGYVSKRLIAGLLGVEAGQDAVFRTILYERGDHVVEPYNYTVNEFTIFISNLRNKLAKCGIKDEGLVVQPELGAENRTCSNILSADYQSLTYTRTPAEIFRTVYASGNESKPGGFFPKGADGRIAREFLEKSSQKS
ncbi:ferritin-like catalase Nec2 [Aristolochia californica]|uniref:ferritin-like catalase Nec2 n=1 Tax=Aristolochia californica TaxID=171875 RepID=UPI0035E335EE